MRTPWGLWAPRLCRHAGVRKRNVTPEPSPTVAQPSDASEPATTIAQRNRLRALWAAVVVLTALLLASLWLHPGAVPR